MKYTEIYNSTYISAYIRLEKLTKNLFIRLYKEDRSYDYALNTFSFESLREIDKRLDLIYHMPGYTSIMEKFELRNKNYTRNAIENVFVNDIYTAFVEIPKEKLPKNYNFNKLVFDFAVIQAYQNLQSTAIKNSALLELIYKLERFELFEIKESKSIKEDKNYIKLLQIKNNLNPVLNFESTLPVDEIGLKLLNYLCDHYRPEDSTQVRFINIHYYMRKDGNKNFYQYKLTQKNFEELILKNYNIKISKFQKSETYFEEEKFILNSKCNEFFKEHHSNKILYQ